MNLNPDGKATATYLENGKFVGSRTLYVPGYQSPSGTRSSCVWPNTAYFCPVCGEIWARQIYDFEFAYQPLVTLSWVIENRKCANHGDGTFLTGFNPASLQFCSRELLAREALLLCLQNPTKEF